MKRLCAVIGAVAMALTLAPPALAAEKCPPEVAPAKAMLQKAAAARKAKTAKGQDVQAPRALAATKGQEVQAPRGQEVQAPRGQEVQAPRALTKARRLVREAELACKKGNMELAAKKAGEAMDLLK